MRRVSLPLPAILILTSLSVLAGAAETPSAAPGAEDREDLLIALLEELGPRYDALVAGNRVALLDEWRRRSATLGRPVRIDLGADDVVGTAVDITAEGHLVVDTLGGERRVFAVGDVTHVRPTD